MGALLAVLLVAVVLAVLVRPYTTPTLPADAHLVEVSGDVPHPGLHLVPGGSLQAALQEAGVDDLSVDEQQVPEGHVVRVEGRQVQVQPPPEPLLVGLPIDLNTASVDQLMAVPGIGASVAGAIVTERRTHGPFSHVGDLTRVPGIGPASLERLEPFVTVPGGVAPPPPGPIDLNQADASALERLPGIGPVTAARIVVDRAERGPFTSVDDLARVKGIGPATVAKLEGLVQVR
jgi:competence protein ComEA